MRSELFVIAILVLFALYSSPVFAEDNFAFFLDKSQYNQRDVIEVSGWVTKVNGTEIFIEIINPNSKIIFQEISELEDTQKIEQQIPTFGGDWNNPGFYTIRLNYGNETHSRLFAFGNFDLQEFEPQISLDREVYSWTDPVKIEVLSPNDNQNNYQIDKIKVDVFAGLSTLKSYVLEETGKTDGVFTGMITLTGDPNFDVNGDGKRGDAPGYTFGPGPDDGYLEARANGFIKVRFSSPHFEETVEKTAQIQFHLAKIEWVDEQIDPNQKITVRVTDPDLMLYPTKKDKIEVYVSALPQGYSWGFPLTETELDSGIFEGHVTLSRWPEEDGVVVGSGTKVSVRYLDRTLPPNFSQRSIEVTDTAKVIDLNYPWENIPDGSITAPEIPDWVRKNVMMWSENNTGDHDFIQALQGLIYYDLIQSPETSKSLEKTVTKVPIWVKNNAKWWNLGLISDKDFLEGIQFLISEKILIVDMENVSEESFSKLLSPRIILNRDEL